MLTVSLIGGSDFLYSREISSAMDSDDPDASKMLVEEQKLKAMLMILQADQVRYGELQDSLFEGTYKGRDEFPRTVVDAYDLLQRISNNIYQKANQSKQNNRRFSFRKLRQIGRRG